MQAGRAAPDRQGGGAPAGAATRFAEAASALLVLLFAYGLPVLGSLAQGGEALLPSGPGDLAQAALFTTLLICSLVLVLQFALHREPLASLTGGPGRLAADLRLAALLLMALIAGAYAAQALAGALAGAETPEVLVKLARACREDPRMLAIMLGPVVWIQAAFTEELTRAFLLRRLAAIWPSPAGRASSLLGLSAIFGLAHSYQGPAGILGTFVIGLILGWAYQIRGRLWPLVHAHGAYDTFALLLLLYATPSPEL